MKKQKQPKKDTSLPIEIQKKLARLDSFTELNPRPIIEIDLEGNVLEINAAAKGLFPDLQKKGAKHPYLSNLSSVVDFLKKEHAPFTREIKIKGRWFRHVFYYVPRFELIHTYGSDITDLKKTEISLRESESRYHALFSKMNEAYALHEIIVDELGHPYDYKFLDVNRAFEAITGLKRKEIIGKTIGHILPKTELSWIQDYGKVALTGEAGYFERHDQYSNKYYRVFAYQPAPNQFATIFFDITDLKLLDVEKNNFISVMSHELRNPLTPILTSAHLLLSETKKEVKGKIDSAGYDAMRKTIKEYAGIIEHQAKNMASLLDDLLDIARLTHKKIMLEKKVINLKDAINNAIKTALPLIHRKQQKLKIHLPDDEIYIEADPVRIEQAIVNILNNASKYTHHKGNITISCQLSEKQLEIAIKDDGVGMKTETIKNIFNLFNTSNFIPFITVESLGVGMNITKNLIEMHGGKVVATSAGEGKGSEFKIIFPTEIIKEHKEQGRLTLAPTPQKSKRGSRVLIVDDNKDIAKLLSKILRQEGYTTKVNYDGLDALETVKTFKPNMALIDIGIPGISGYQLAKEIRKQPVDTPVKLVAVTGYGQQKDKIQAKEAGFDHHLTKPIQVDSLLRILS